MMATFGCTIFTVWCVVTAKSHVTKKYEISNNGSTTLHIAKIFNQGKKAQRRSGVQKCHSQECKTKACLHLKCRNDVGRRLDQARGGEKQTLPQVEHKHAQIHNHESHVGIAQKAKIHHYPEKQIRKLARFKELERILHPAPRKDATGKKKDVTLSHNSNIDHIDRIEEMNHVPPIEWIGGISNIQPMEPIEPIESIPQIEPIEPIERFEGIEGMHPMKSIDEEGSEKSNIPDVRRVTNDGHSINNTLESNRSGSEKSRISNVQQIIGDMVQSANAAHLNVTFAKPLNVNNTMNTINVNHDGSIHGYEDQDFEDTTGMMYQSPGATGVINQATGVMQDAEGVVFEARGVVHLAQGVDESALGVTDPATGVTKEAKAATGAGLTSMVKKRDDLQNKTDDLRNSTDLAPRNNSVDYSTKTNRFDMDRYNPFGRKLDDTSLHTQALQPANFYQRKKYDVNNAIKADFPLHGEFKRISGPKRNISNILFRAQNESSFHVHAKNENVSKISSFKDSNTFHDEVIPNTSIPAFQNALIRVLTSRNTYHKHNLHNISGNLTNSGEKLQKVVSSGNDIGLSDMKNERSIAEKAISSRNTNTSILDGATLNGHNLRSNAGRIDRRNNSERIGILSDSWNKKFFIVAKRNGTGKAYYTKPRNTTYGGTKREIIIPKAPISSINPLMQDPPAINNIEKPTLHPDPLNMLDEKIEMQDSKINMMKTPDIGPIAQIAMIKNNIEPVEKLELIKEQIPAINEISDLPDIPTTKSEISPE